MHLLLGFFLKGGRFGSVGFVVQLAVCLCFGPGLVALHFVGAKYNTRAAVSSFVCFD